MNASPEAYAVIQLFNGKQIAIRAFPNKVQADSHYDMLTQYPESRAPLCDDVRMALFFGAWVGR